MFQLSFSSTSQNDIIVHSIDNVWFRINDFQQFCSTHDRPTRGTARSEQGLSKQFATPSL